MPNGLNLNPPQDGLGLMDQAKQQYPVLRGMDIGYKYSPGAQPYMLETWPAHEQGSSSYPRPKELPMGSLGMEVYDPKTRPIDILGDIVSHHLIKTDPKIQGYYNNFKQSLTPEQQARLQSQYKWAQKNQKETRPYDQWAESSGIPAYFRGYPFQQWENASSLYTHDQMDMLDEMMATLRGEIPVGPTRMGKAIDKGLFPLYKGLDMWDQGMNKAADMLRQLDPSSSDAARARKKKQK